MSMPRPNLPVLNLEEAKFECTYGRGCVGICCREGRPPVYDEEVQVIAAHLHVLLPLLRPAARQLIERKGFVTQRRRFGRSMLRVAEQWCVFFNDGCVLHRVGAQEGDKFRYKPSLCALFPIQADEHDAWYVRQKGFKNEKWDLFCLDAGQCSRPAAETLREELALAQRFAEEIAATRPGNLLPNET
ncbi:MAG: DUF3109 family protein [Longimicrobiales bacterium]